jgi:hypothetical protein
MRFVPPPRVEDDHEKASAEGTRLICPACVVIALWVRGTRLVDTSGVCDGSTGFTDAGSSFIDMGDQFACSQSIGTSGRSKEHGGTLAARREASFLSGFWFLVSGFWFLVSGFWFLVSRFWFLVSGFSFLVS